MIIYNVTINIDDEVHDEWLKWMKDIHIPEVLSKGIFFENKICRVLVTEEKGKTYSIQYTCRNMEDYEQYQKEYAPELQQKHNKRYKDKFVAFRTLLQVI